MIKFDTSPLTILEDLQKYKRPKQELFVYYIEERLNAAMTQYYKQLALSVSTLRYRDTAEVINNLDE